MVSPPACALASRMAWRKDPAPLLAVLVTTSGPPVSSVRHAENSDVLPVGLVAVALRIDPIGTGSVVMKSKLKADVPMAKGTACVPRKCSPSPLPLVSHVLFRYSANVNVAADVVRRGSDPVRCKPPAIRVAVV